nr:hypothetical protein [Tanacetum cinerariifolium]
MADVNLNVNAPAEQAPAMAPPTYKKNLALHIQGKKKSNPIVFPSIRFTKLIIHHLQTKHKFYRRPDSPLHFPYEEYIIRYLKFSDKGTKREVFRMPILNELITADIRGSDPDSPAPKPAKATKKSKPSAPKVVPVTKPAAAQQPKPKLAPAKTQEKKHEFVDEGIPKKEPRGLIPPVVFREPDFGKFQPLPEVKGKGKEKVCDEHVSLDLLTLQTPKKAGSNPGDDAEPQPQLSPVVHVGPNLKHIDLKATDASTQQNHEQIDEGFTTIAYPNVPENLKLTIKEHVILEELASSTGTLSSLQYLAKDFSFGDQFFNDKPSEAENEKTTIETKAESMVYVTIQQDTSVIPPMTTPVIDLTSRPDSPNVHQPLQATATETTTTTTKTHPPAPQPQQSTTDSILIKHIGELKQIMANLIQYNKHLKERLDSHGSHLPEADMKDILHQRMWETNSYKAHEDHTMLYEALEKSMNRDHTDELLTDLVEARRKKKKRHDSSKTPLGSPPHQPPPPSPPASLSRTLGSPRAFRSSQLPPPPPPLSTKQSDQPSVSLIPTDLHMDDDTAPDKQVHSSDDEDIENAYIPKVNLQQDWWKLLKEDIPATPEPAWYNVSKPLSLGGPPGQMKAAYYPDVGLEQMVLDQMWIEEECKYDIVAIIEVFSMYGYDYMKKIVIRRADLNEHIITERDFKYLYPNDFEDLYLLNLQGHLNHLPPKDKKILTTATQLNLTKPQWDATGFEYKYEFMVIDSPRVVTFRDKYGVQMIMRFNDIHKFSDGTLHQIDEALDYQVKEFKVNRMNSGKERCR